MRQNKPRGAKVPIDLDREVRAIRRLQKSATAHGRRFLADVVEIGKRLDRVKANVGHGNWIPWLKKNFDMSGDTASNYARLYALSLTPEFRRLRNLPLDVLYLLARKSTPPEAVAQVLRRVEAGERPHIIISEVRAERRTALTPPLPVLKARESSSDHTGRWEGRFTTPEPSDEELAQRIWNQVLDLMQHGLQVDWRDRLDADLSALELAQARRVRELLHEKVNQQIERLSDQLEHLRAAVEYLRAEKQQALSVVGGTETSTKH